VGERPRCLLRQVAPDAAKALRTIELYSQSVRYFSRWLADLAAYWQASTVAPRMRGMRRFCRWLVVEGERDKAPTEGIEIASTRGKARARSQRRRDAGVISPDGVASSMCEATRARRGI
jgi:site-specific recombinase XerC